MQENTQRRVLHINAELEGLVPLFLEKRRKDLVDIRAAIERQDQEMLTRIGHNLKGIGAGYGFQRITEIGDVMETAARGNDLVQVSSCLDEMKTYLENIEIIFV